MILGRFARSLAPALASLSLSSVALAQSAPDSEPPPSSEGAVEPTAAEPTAVEPDDESASSKSAAIDEAEPVPPEEAPIDRSLIEEDVAPSVAVASGDRIEIRVGGMVQVFAAPYAADGALIENGDPVTRAGFRLRRARLGFEARFAEPLRVSLTLDPLSGEGYGLTEAKVTYGIAPWLRLAVGTGKVPFARGEIESSRRLATIERPLVVSEISPGYRLGATAEGDVMEGRLAYVVGVMNGTDGLGEGNEYGGVLTGARVQFTALGEPAGIDVAGDGVVIGASAFYEDAPATHGYAAAADLLVALAGFELVLEGLWDTRTPDDAPDVAPTLADKIERLGAHATLLYQVPGLRLEPVVRAELLDDNTDVEDAGDVVQLSGGVNADVIEDALRAQLHYIRRVERHGPAVANDAVVLSVLGAF